MEMPYILQSGFQGGKLRTTDGRQILWNLDVFSEDDGLYEDKHITNEYYKRKHKEV